MRLNYQLSQPVRVVSRWISCATCIMISFNYPIPCGMDPGGSYVHGDTDFVSIIPAREGWVLGYSETAISKIVSIIPTRKGWVTKQLHITIPERQFQSSQPARVGSSES